MGSPMAMRRRYVDTSAGQMHWREAGTGPPVVLMHWVPLSGRMYAAELPWFAKHGFRAIAIDLMGFGQSKCEQPLDFIQQANCVLQALASENVLPVTLLGAHYSAPVATEIAASRQDAVTGLCLDGCAHLLPAEDGAKIAAKVGGLPGPGLHEDASHVSFLWQQALTAYRVFDPAFVLNDDTLPLIYRFIGDYLETGPRQSFGSFDPYPLAERLRTVRCPVLVLTAENDPLRGAFEPTRQAARDAAGHLFKGSHPLHDPDRAGEYAGAVVDFISATEGTR